MPKRTDEMIFISECPSEGWIIEIELHGIIIVVLLIFLYIYLQKG